MAKMATEPPKKTHAQQYRELLDRAEKLKGQAVEGLKTEIAEKITELNEYGYSYRLTDQQEFTAPAKKQGRPAGTGKTKPATPVAGPSANYNADKQCSICGMISHDGRAHRSQDPKKPFTSHELAERGLMPPEGTPVQQPLQ